MSFKLFPVFPMLLSFYYYYYFVWTLSKLFCNASNMSVPSFNCHLCVIVSITSLRKCKLCSWLPVSNTSSEKLPFSRALCLCFCSFTFSFFHDLSQQFQNFLRLQDYLFPCGYFVADLYTSVIELCHMLPSLNSSPEAWEVFLNK